MVLIYDNSRKKKKKIFFYFKKKRKTPFKISEKKRNKFQFYHTTQLIRRIIPTRLKQSQ